MSALKFAPDQSESDAQDAPVRGDSLPTTSQCRRDAQSVSAGGGAQLDQGHVVLDSHAGSALVNTLPEPANEVANTHQRAAGSDATSTGTETILGVSPKHGPSRPGGFLRDPVLGVLADVLDDMEGVRIANANRVRILTRTEEDSDGEERGHGLDESHPEVAKLIATVTAMSQFEHDAVLNLQRALRKHPLAVFQKRHRGLGEKQFARLLATIGDPYWNDLHDRPRTVSELWAYSGMHVIKTSSSSHSHSDTQFPDAAAGSKPHAGGQASPDTHPLAAPGMAPRRTRGIKSNWSEEIRKRIWVIASSCVKGGRMADDKRGPQDPMTDKYRIAYDEARAKYAESVHPADCVRCGPAGKPALADTPLSDAHKHARALRIVSKTILRDMWIEARALYETETP